MIKRLTTRLAVLLWALALAIVPLAGHAGAQDATPAASPVALPNATPVAGTGLEGATAWLLSQQRGDGSFPGFSGESDPGTTLDALVALVAADQAGIDTGSATDDAIAYLGSDDTARVYTETGVGQAAKLVLGLIAAGQDPRDIGGVDPLAIVEQGQDGDSGIYGTGIFDHALAIMALTSAGVEVPASAFAALASTQAENGGWAFDASTDPASADTNTTALVVQALVASGNGDSELMEPAVAYLQSSITSTGAVYAVSEGAIADANSTALVLQAMIVTENDNTATLENALTTYQGPSGAFFYQGSDPTDNLFSTVQAIPALAGLALPVLPAGDALPSAGLWLVAA